jgi:hypothetical protein
VTVSSAPRGARALAIAWLALVAITPSTRARADDEEPQAPVPVDPAAEARQQYNLGAQAYAAHRFVEAATHFEAAAAQRAHAVTLYTAALAWEQGNRPERAADDFARALAVPGLSAQQMASAHERLATLETSLGTLDVTGPEGTRVQLDALTEVAVPARLHALPGEHVLTVRAPSGTITRRDVSIELGTPTHLGLEPEAPPAPPPAPAPLVEAPPPPARAPLELRTTIGVTSIGVGVALGIGGIVLGESALGARDAYDAAPTRAAYDHASSLQTWTNVAFVGAGVFVAGGLVAVLWPHRAPAPSTTAHVALVPSLGGAVLQGGF